MGVDAILKSWHSRRISQEKRRTTLAQLNDGSVSGVDNIDVKKELRSTTKDLERRAGGALAPNR